MKIAFLMRQPAPGGHSVTTDVVRLLRDWGTTVDVIHPENQATNLAEMTPSHDLYVLRSVSDASISHAGILDSLGARIINPYPVSRDCRDKVLVTALLLRAGIPVPGTWVVERPTQLAPLLNGGPVVVKPTRGSQGRGVHVVWDTDELLELGAGDGPMLAQRFYPRQGRDRKLYCIGGQLFGVKRVWPTRTYEEKTGEPFTVTAELRDIALQVGAVIGTDLFGLDIVISDDRPYVVDVNPFPGFKGVPEAALRLADYVYDATALAASEAGQERPRPVGLTA